MTSLDKSLGQLCVEFSIAEMAREQLPSPSTKMEWFRHCERSGRLIFSALTPALAAKLNHCAAAACYAAESMAQHSGWVAPHGYRASAKELMADAVESGAWHPRSAVAAGVWFPEAGDLAIYDRSVPGRPETAWWGHVNRVIAINKGTLTYQEIGANEGPGGAWHSGVSRFDNPKLLGFIAYPRLAETTGDEFELSDADREHILSLVALTADEAEAAWWNENKA